MALRINTVRCQFSHEITTEKPTVKEVLNWVFNDLTKYINELENDLIGIQNEPDGFFMKFNNQEICDEIINKLNGEGKIKKEDNSIYKISIQLASIGVRMVRILRLPFELSNTEIKNSISKFGQVLSIEDEYWSTNYTPHAKKYKNGNRVVKCNLNSHLPSFLYINGFRAMIQYDGQPKTCSYCGSNEHLIAQCTKSTFKPRSYSSAVSRTEPTYQIEEPTQNPTFIIPQIPAPTATSSRSTTPGPIPAPNTQPNTNLETNPTYKRIHSTSSTDETLSENINDESEEERDKKTHNVLKKSKTREDSDKHNEYIEEIKKNITPFIMEHQRNFILTPSELISFFKDAKNNDDILPLSKDYTNKTSDFLNMLEVIHKNTQHKSLKATWKRLITRLTTEMEAEALISIAD